MATSMKTNDYLETFDEGPGGWWGWIDNFQGPCALERAPSAIVARSPWWIDYNHAPPGAGYLHMLAGLTTSGRLTEAMRETGGPNHFLTGGFSTNLTAAQASFRIKGEVRQSNAQLLLLIQGNVDDLCSGWLLSAQPLEVTGQWTTQTLILNPDPDQWTPLGSRHDRADMYGVKPLTGVLANVDVNIMLVMFPLDVVPMGDIPGDPHRLRPERDYPVWRSCLPEGYVMIDEVQIRFHDS